MRFHFGMDFGGIESMLLRQLPRLNAAGFRVSVCLLRREGALADDLRRAGVPVHLLRTRGRIRPGSLREIAAFLRAEAVEIAHAHSRAVYVPVTIAARLAGTPVMVGSVHEMHSVGNWRRALQEKLLDRWRDCMVTVSDEVADDYSRTAGIARAKCTTIYNGLDADAFRASAAPREAARASLGLAPGELAVVTVGRLQPQKAHEHLIGAAQLVASRYPGLAVRYLVVGEGPRQAGLEALAGEAGLAGRMQFLGARRDVPSLLAAADLCCLTSRYEGFSNVVLECLIMGLPVVATDAGGVREAIEDGRSGWIVPVGDVAALADRIARLLRDDGLRRRMGHAARERGATFSIDANVQATAALYRRLLAQKGRMHAH